MSRLKNRTMDEIISRWASDLSKYQKDFQEQATKVASWDRLLVENGDKIQKLYVSTFEAERATSEVEKQLTAVENMQGELEGWLDRYEKDVDELFNRNLGSSDNLQGPDQERERMYTLAEKLAGRLDDMGKDLTSMIQEINAASSSLSKAGKPDDPVSFYFQLNVRLHNLTIYSYNRSSRSSMGICRSSNGSIRTPLRSRQRSLPRRRRAVASARASTATTSPRHLTRCCVHIWAGGNGMVMKWVVITRTGTGLGIWSYFPKTGAWSRLFIAHVFASGELYYSRQIFGCR